MVKYYITCGKNKVIVLAYTPEQAAMKSVPYLDKQLTSQVRISERGHDHHVDDIIMDTQVLFLLAFWNRIYLENQ